MSFRFGRVSIVLVTAVGAFLLASARAPASDSPPAPAVAPPSPVSLGPELVQRVIVLDDTCPNDLSGNGFVDFADIFEIMLALGPCAACRQDLNGSGSVDFGDIFEVIIDWGPCPPQLGYRLLTTPN